MFKLKDILKTVVLIGGIIMIISISFYDRQNKAKIIRKASKEEFDNFDIQAYKNYVTGGSYSVESAPANIADFKPTKTSKLVTLMNESIEEGIEW